MNARTKLSLTLILTASLAPLHAQPAAPPAAQPGDIIFWPNGTPPATAARSTFGDTHAMMISHRTATGRVEVHQKTADVVIVQTGTATLITGGEVVDPVTTGPNEVGGASIKGGTSRTVSAGDVYEIPAGVPHQYIVPAGGQVTCLLIKVMKQ